MVQAGTFKQPSYIEDGQLSLRPFISFRAPELTFTVTEDMIYDHKFAPEDCLGLDHLDKSGRTRQGGGEKAIVIKG